MWMVGPVTLLPRQLLDALALHQRPCAGRRRAARAAAAAVEKGPVVVIDNYDSFTYNLCQYLGDLGCEHVVFANDAKSVEDIAAMNPRGILVSPGPGRPEDSGISLEIIQKLGPAGFPVFGVCMGHQCIGQVRAGRVQRQPARNGPPALRAPWNHSAELPPAPRPPRLLQVFGGDVVRAPSGVMHGKTSPVWHSNVGLMEGLANPFNAARYHSLVIARDSCPEELEVTAWCEDGTIMAVRHRAHPHIQGVQFHPESIITDNGKRIVKNFVDSL